MIGILKYIIIKQSGAETNFNLATYQFEGPKYTIDKNGILQQSLSLKSFTGSLHLKSLTKKSAGVIKYINGKREKDKVKQKVT